MKNFPLVRVCQEFVFIKSHKTGAVSASYANSLCGVIFLLILEASVTWLNEHHCACVCEKKLEDSVRLQNYRASFYGNVNFRLRFLSYRGKQTIWFICDKRFRGSSFGANSEKRHSEGFLKNEVICVWSFLMLTFGMCERWKFLMGWLNCSMKHERISCCTKTLNETIVH